MHVEMTRGEAAIVIAVLTFAEGAALVENPGMVEALKALRPWRTALLSAYLRSAGEPTEAAQGQSRSTWEGMANE